MLDILWWKHEVCIVHRMRLQDGWFGNMVALLPTWHQIPGAPDHIQTFDLLLPLSFWLVQVSLLTPHCWQGTSSICWGDLLPGWVTIPSCKHANIKGTVGMSSYHKYIRLSPVYASFTFTFHLRHGHLCPLAGTYPHPQLQQTGKPVVTLVWHVGSGALSTLQTSLHFGGESKPKYLVSSYSIALWSLPSRAMHLN